MNKRFFKFISMVVCLTLLFGLTKGVMVANATETLDYPVVSSADELLAAIESADHGDTIGIDNHIIFRKDFVVGSEEKSITIVRTSRYGYLDFGGTGSSIIQNIIFDGGNIKSDYQMVYIDQNITVQNCVFKNCICSTGQGGAIGIYGGRANFYCSIFENNQSIVGGHVLVNGALYVVFDECVFTKGNAVTRGGAIAVSSSTTYEVNNCTITENQTGNYGGGIYNAGRGVLSQTKLYNNTVTLCGTDYASETGATLNFVESVKELEALFEEDGLKPIEWEIQTDVGITGAKLILEDITPTEPEEPDETEPTEPDEPTEEPEQPTTPDGSETPGESEPDDTEPTEPGESEPSTDGEQTDDPTEENPSEGDSDAEPDTPQDDTPEEIPPSDDEGTGEPDQQPEESTPSNSTVDNSTTDNSVTDNSNTDSSTTGDIITDNSSSSSTDNSTSSNHESATDNSRYSNTTDSNNTSTVNNYYTQPGTQPSNNQPEVQTIVVPVGNAGNGEPIEQTITIQSSPEGNGSGSLEGMTLNVNVNIGSENAADQQEALSPSTVQQSGASWYQVAVLCLLSAILVCVIRRR